MTYDYVFKSVLSENKEYLARILSNILNIDKDYILDNLVYKNTEHTKLSKKYKRKISDLIVEVENMKINLEMNKGYYKSLTHKNNMYIYRLILESIKEKEEYIDYDKMIIQVNFDVKWKFRDKLITKFEMIEKETGIILKESYPLIYKVEYYNRNFPLEGDVTYTEFNYFLIRTDDLPNKNNMNLDEWEKEHNYECVYVKLEDLDDLLSTTMNDHHMNKIVYKEIKATIKEYYKYIKDER